MPRIQKTDEGNKIILYTGSFDRYAAEELVDEIKRIWPDYDPRSHEIGPIPDPEKASYIIALINARSQHIERCKRESVNPKLIHVWIAKWNETHQLPTQEEIET
jgi:hypothetical protein